MSVLILPPLEKSTSRCLMIHLLCLVARLHKAVGPRCPSSQILPLGGMTKDGRIIIVFTHEHSPSAFWLLGHPPGFPSPSGSGHRAAFLADTRTRIDLYPSLVAAVQPCYKSCLEGCKWMVLHAKKPIKQLQQIQRELIFIKELWKSISK